MLVLNRKVGQQLVLPGLDVTIEVLAVHRSRVVVGFTASRGVAIRRQELAPLHGGNCEEERGIRAGRGGEAAADLSPPDEGTAEGI